MRREMEAEVRMRRHQQELWMHRLTLKPKKQYLLVVREREDSRKRTHPDVESEPRKLKRQTIRHNYQKLHDPDPEWAYLEHKSGYTKEGYTEIGKILFSLTRDKGLNMGTLRHCEKHKNQTNG
jgi:hypothetical protein